MDTSFRTKYNIGTYTNINCLAIFEQYDQRFFENIQIAGNGDWMAGNSPADYTKISTYFGYNIIKY